MIAKNKIYLIVIFLVLLLEVSTKFFLNSLAELRSLSQRVIFQKKVEKLLELRVKNFENFQKNLPVFEEISQKIESSFVRKDAPIKFIEFLEKLAKDARISLKIKPLDLKKKENDLWEPVGFQITLLGKFSQCLRFLEKLERAPWLVEIYQLSIDRITEEKLRFKEFQDLKTGDVSFSLSFKTFSYEAPN